MKIRTSVRYRTSLSNKPFYENMRLKESTGCLEWTGHRYPQGYGRCLAVIGEPETLRAHRRAWEMKHGEIPKGMDVLHKCDNPSCVNVDHLFLGTDIDNTRDKQSKKRDYKLAGADHPLTPFAPEDVRRIREAALFGARPIDLARSCGVSDAAIHSIVARRSWAHLE